LVGDLHERVGEDERVYDHILDCFRYETSEGLKSSYSRCTGLVIVNHFVQFEPSVAYLVKLVHVLDIVADLVVDDAGTLDEPWDPL
jgi:hypothetical protein